METVPTTTVPTLDLIHELGSTFAERASAYDTEGTFVYKNYEELKACGLFSAMVPKELGGAGVTHAEMSEMIRTLAHYCGSTALAFSMHQHLIAAAVWKYRHMGKSGPMLRKVAQKQIVLVSTGARDWLGSNGEMVKTEGGYLLTARKHFASQSAGGDVAVTSAPYQNESGEWKVLHFPVPIRSKGVTVLDDWDVMGMRGSGSQTIVMDKVFIPDSAIALERPRDVFHPVWNVVLTVAMPLIMSAYVGLAERAVEIAIAKGKKYVRNQDHMKYIIGQLNNHLLAAQVQWKAMVALTDNFNFTIDQDQTVGILSLKTNVADACIQTVSLAMEGVGGQSFYRKNELERIFRDVQAGQFHPLPKWEQYAFTGEKILADQ